MENVKLYVPLDEVRDIPAVDMARLHPIMIPEEGMGAWEREDSSLFGVFIWRCDRCGGRHTRRSRFCPDCGMLMKNAT